MSDKLDAVCIGTCLMDISTDGLDFNTFYEKEPNLANRITFSAGGDALNESIALSRLGHRVGFISRVGDDFVGRFLQQEAENNRVDASGVHIEQDCPTAVNNILIGTKDKRIYTVAQNADSRTTFCEEDLSYDLICNARLVAFGSIFVHEKFGNAALTTLFRTAKEHGAITCADVCPSGEACSLDTMRDAMPYVDYIFPNHTEAAYLSGKTEPDEMADYFLGLGIGTVIIKFGSKGSFVKNRAQCFWQPPFYVTPVDTTGAGDCYASGFMSGLLRGLSLRECARYASAAGALAVSQVGATAGIQSSEQVAAFLAARAVGQQADNLRGMGKEQQ